MSGSWRLTYSLISRVESTFINICYLYLNGVQLDETRHYTFSERSDVTSTGGRMVTLEANAGDKIEIRAGDRMDGIYWRILFCGEYIPKM